MNVQRELVSCAFCVNLIDGAICSHYQRRILTVNPENGCEYFEQKQRDSGSIRPYGLWLCRTCGIEDYPIVANGRGPHIGALRCPRCEGHHKWLSKDEWKLLSVLDIMEVIA